MILTMEGSLLLKTHDQNFKYKLVVEITWFYSELVKKIMKNSYNIMKFFFKAWGKYNYFDMENIKWSYYEY